MKPLCDMTKQEFIESKRGIMPSHEFFMKVMDWFESLSVLQKNEYLDKFNYTDQNKKVAIEKGIGNSSSFKNEFNDLCWYLYDEKIIDGEIISEHDFKTWRVWADMPDTKNCTVCNKEFDFRETKRKNLQKIVCDEHLITKREDIPKESIPMGMLSFELQKMYWEAVTDKTLNELSKAGVVKKV